MLGGCEPGVAGGAVHQGRQLESEVNAKEKKPREGTRQIPAYSVKHLAPDMPEATISLGFSVMRSVQFSQLVLLLNLD